MFDRIKEFLSGEIDVNRYAWHYHLYRWWIMHGGHNRPGYRENLCHYMRVLLFWTPLYWFFKVPLIWKIRPWMLILTPIWLLAFWAGNTSERLWLVILSVLYTYYVYMLFDREGLMKFFDLVSPPFVWLWLHGLRSFCHWFFKTGTMRVIYPWTVTLLVGLGLLYHFLVGKIGLIKLLIIVGGFLGGIMLMAFVLGMIFWLSDMYADSRLDRARQGPKGQGSSTLKVAAHFVMAKKRRICPFIRLPDDPFINQEAFR